MLGTLNNRFASQDISARRPAKACLKVENLEGREMLDAKMMSAVLPAAAEMRRVAQVQPMQIDYGTALQAAPATSGSYYYNAVPTSVVTIRNPTANRVNYYIMWPGTGWTQFSVEAYSSRMHWTAGSNKVASISFDKSFAAGYQKQTYNLTSRDFAATAWTTPKYNTDGMQYYFKANRYGLGLFADVTLNKSAFSQYRAGVNANNDFPRLMSNFEVVGAPTRVYNCIAHSLGLKDRWVNPITSAGANKLAGMDQLYAKQGYRRISGLNFNLQAGYQKVVVYATRYANGTIKEVTHAAIQTRDGAYTSKLGQNALIKHVSPNDIGGGLYGEAVAVYIRRVR